MNTLADTLADLGDTDVTISDLRALIAAGSGDDITQINIDAVLKRRRDLERQLDATLRIEQHDLVHIRLVHDNGDPAPVATVARLILLFQELTTAVFDAVRDGPKPRYEPSEENIALSSLSFGSPPADTRTISLSIPNDRLLGIRSDLDLSFELVFALFQLRSAADLTRFAEKTGVTPISKLHDWSSIIVGQRLHAEIVWQKTRDSRYAVAVSSRDAAEIKDLIAATATEQAEDIDLEGRLVSLNESNSTFCVQTSDNEQISGLLAYEFPRGNSWATNTALVAVLKKSTRIDYATGAATVRWTLNQLIPIE